jgi:hypothetical protein
VHRVFVRPAAPLIRLGNDRYSPRYRETGLSPFLLECAKQGKTGRFEVSEAATVRADDGGQTQVTTGPGVQAGSGLDGYYVYDAADFDAAIAFAARIPVARFGGTVEVRPMLER